MRVHSAIASALADHSVDTIFGVMGDANMSIINDLVQTHGTRFVTAAHEAGATMMADGAARVTGRIGVVTTTQGPGLTNTVTALTEAVRNGTEMLLVCGDTPSKERQNLQDIIQRDVILATGAGFEQVRSSDTAVNDVAIAMRRASLERRPIVLNVPSDLQSMETEYVASTIDITELPAFPPSNAALDRAVGVIAAARRPIVLAGRGATSRTARDSVLRLAERIEAPVATTLLAKDLFVGAPSNLGIFGTLISPIASEIVDQADCVIAFGAALNRHTTDRNGLLQGKRIVHCDANPGAIGRWAPVTVPVTGDTALTADAIVTWLDAAEFEPTGFASDELVRRLAEHEPRSEFQDRSTGTTIDLRTALIRLNEILPATRTLIVDAGRFAVPAMKYVHVGEPDAYVHTFNFGSVGLSMGAAVGAAIARPERTAVVVLGDGGFMMGGLAEFNSAVRHHVDLIAVVANDGCYGAEHMLLQTRGMNPDLSLLEWPDFSPVAEALGGRGVTVRSPMDLEKLGKMISDRDRPLLIDVKLDPNWPSIQH